MKLQRGALGLISVCGFEELLVADRLHMIEVAKSSNEH